MNLTLEMDEKKEISVYNEAVQQIIRLGNHWVDISRYREQGKLKKVKFKLDSVESELDYDVNHQLKEYKYDQKLKEINEEISKNELKIIKAIKKDKKFNPFELQDLYNQYLYRPLLKKEKLLKEIQQMSGKGSSYKSSEEEDMD